MNRPPITGSIDFTWLHSAAKLVNFCCGSRRADTWICAFCDALDRQGRLLVNALIGNSHDLFGALRSQNVQPPPRGRGDTSRRLAVLAAPHGLPCPPP